MDEGVRIFSSKKPTKFGPFIYFFSKLPTQNLPLGFHFSKCTNKKLRVRIPAILGRGGEGERGGGADKKWNVPTTNAIQDGS